MPAPINLNRFDLASLRLFVMTVETGSLTAGAERFGISLAAASKRMAELEAHVGNALLARSKRGVVPTPAGQTLHRHAIELVARLEQLALAMGDFQRGAAGHLRLWANTSAFGGFLPDVLAAYSAAHPDVRDRPRRCAERRRRARGGARRAELAVIGENTPTEGLHTLVCDIDELVLLVPASHALACAASVPFARALDHDFVALGRSTSLTRQISAAAESTGRTLRDPRAGAQLRCHVPHGGGRSRRGDPAARRGRAACRCARPATAAARRRVDAAPAAAGDARPRGLVGAGASVRRDGRAPLDCSSGALTLRRQQTKPTRSRSARVCGPDSIAMKRRADTACAVRTVVAAAYAVASSNGSGSAPASVTPLV